MLVVDADAGGLVGCGGLGVLGSDDGGGLGLAGSGGVLFGLPGACVGLADLAGGLVACGTDVAGCAITGLLDLFARAGADAAYFGFGGVPKFVKFAFQVIHTGDGLGGGVVGLLAVGACGVALGLGVPSALDLFAKAGLRGGNALVGAGAGGVHLGFGRLDVSYCAQLPDGAGDGVSVLGGELFQCADELAARVMPNVTGCPPVSSARWPLASASLLRRSR